MATRSFVYSALVIMLVMIIVASALTVAFAEEVYMVQGTITGFELTEYGDLEVKVTDTNGTIWCYFDDEDVRLGETVFLTLFDYGDGEEDEVVDVVYIERLAPQQSL